MSETINAEQEQPKTDNTGMEFALKEQKAVKHSNEGSFEDDDFKPKEDSPHSEDAQREIWKLHQESKNRRLKAKELQSQLDDLTNRVKKMDEQKMLEEGKLKELLEQKEKELEALLPLKEENETFKSHFSKQLETAMNKLSPDQVELINESNMPVAKKLEWALRLADNKLSQSDSPDKARPGGKADEPSVNLDEYRGPAGQKKLISLQFSNPTLYKKILDLKSQEQ